MSTGGTITTLHPESDASVTYEFVPGFFFQSEPKDKQPPIAGILPRFGLIDSSPGHWSRFVSQFSALQRDAPPGVSYKLFILGRHGQGFHNVAEAKYGTEAWDDYWSKLDTDGKLVWGPDSDLTSVGETQASDARTAWIIELANGIPIPNLYYCSPMTRALRTYTLTFRANIDVPLVEEKLNEDSRAMILEDCREQYGEHTCDKRRSLSYLRSDLSHFPHFNKEFVFEPGFSEEDELWKADERETYEHIEMRARRIMDTAFASDHVGHDVISVTSHSGFINGFLRAAGHPTYQLLTGGILPIIVRRCIQTGNPTVHDNHHRQ